MNGKGRPRRGGLPKGNWLPKPAIPSIAGAGDAGGYCAGGRRRYQPLLTRAWSPLRGDREGSPEATERGLPTTGGSPEAALEPSAGPSGHRCGQPTVLLWDRSGSYLGGRSAGRLAPSLGRLIAAPGFPPPPFPGKGGAPLPCCPRVSSGVRSGYPATFGHRRHARETRVSDGSFQSILRPAGYASLSHSDIGPLLRRRPTRVAVSPRSFGLPSVLPLSHSDIAVTLRRHASRMAVSRRSFGCVSPLCRESRAASTASRYVVTHRAKLTRGTLAPCPR